MKRIKKTFSFFYKCFVIYTLVVYALLFWFPFKGWFWGFVMMSFPVVIAGHLIILAFSLFSSRKNVLLPLLVLLLGCIFLPRTYSFRSGPEKVTSKQEKSFKVMSYNVHGFQHNSQASKDQVNRDIKEMKEWIVNTKADILCLPEYINYSNTELMDATLELKRAGYKHVAYLNQTKWNMPHSYWGMAMFSKYPIIAQKDTVFEMQNGMIQSDIKVQGNTVRLISLHLLSMTLKLNAFRQQKTLKGVARESKKTTKLIKRGFDNHALEMTVLESWIKESPYPVIVCGDFNETPYSYVYGKTRSLLKSTFEEKGRGFGFTFNKLPYFIRIDHQFYDKNKLDLVDFQTVDSVRYSDHYPLIGTYEFAKARD
ncbi:endonuclease/exonuclease/phosphatase family protein [Dyadobacter psychrotolerans]|uniref:Endonuclease/exonuclease/phosphatase n=1 Tax=Dyadobacter psychrotolerans TaxID=2541721 RepID=A0A4R5DEY0_9BACT|nr:endonuclease/exonuclease/phosphatase family protein [Dyadobacter psychrotolerans]TDE10490.1 endonuclease/exonuclease/phosphatase [Dyadobacter psychrotolerans]